MSIQRSRTALASGISFLAVPWGGFVAAFLFYVGLTLVAISGTQLPGLAMAAAYLVPACAYVAVLVTRAARALAAIPVHIGHLALPRLQ